MERIAVQPALHQLHHPLEPGMLARGGKAERPSCGAGSCLCHLKLAKIVKDSVVRYGNSE